MATMHEGRLRKAVRTEQQAAKDLLQHRMRPFGGGSEVQRALGEGQNKKDCEEESGDDEMGLYKRSGVYWYEFVYKGRRYRESTGVKNQRTAGDIERAFRTALAKGEVGITERKAIPAFSVAISDFLKWSTHSHKKPTQKRYKTSSVALLGTFRILHSISVTPEEVERFKTTRAARSIRPRAGKESALGPISDCGRQPSIGSSLA